MPRGGCNSIQKCAGANRFLRSSEDPIVRGRQILREELWHGIRCKVEKAASVDFEASDAWRRWIVLLRISRRFAGIWRERCHVDKGGNSRVISGLRDDSSAVTLADEHDRV